MYRPSGFRRCYNNALLQSGSLAPSHFKGRYLLCFKTKQCSHKLNCYCKYLALCWTLYIVLLISTVLYRTIADAGLTFFIHLKLCLTTVPHNFKFVSHHRAPQLQVVSHHRAPQLQVVSHHRAPQLQVCVSPPCPTTSSLCLTTVPHNLKFVSHHRAPQLQVCVSPPCPTTSSCVSPPCPTTSSG